MRDLAGLTGTTARLDVRLHRPEDLEEFADLHGRDDVARYLPWPTRDLAASREALERHLQRTTWSDDPEAALTLAAFDRGSGVLVGDLYLMHRAPQHRGAEVGYAVHPDHAGRGYATEGTLAVLALAFDVLRLHRVVARVDARNTASLRVLTKAGLRREAELRSNEWFKGEWTDEVDFALLEEEWAARPDAPAVTWAVAGVPLVPDERPLGGPPGGG